MITAVGQYGWNVDPSTQDANVLIAWGQNPTTLEISNRLAGLEMNDGTTFCRL